MFAALLPSAAEIRQIGAFNRCLTFIPGLPLEQVGDEWHSHAWCVELMVFRFARVTEQVERDVGTPVHYLKPAAAGRCLQQARAVLGLELRGRELSDALELLDGVWERLNADQRIEAMLTIDDFEEAQAGPLPPLSGAGPAGNIATLRTQLEVA